MSFISRALVTAGYEIDCCARRRERRSGWPARASIGLVILDLIMPDMDGRAVLARLLRGPPEQAVLVLSCLDDVTHQGRLPGPGRAATT